MSAPGLAHWTRQTPVPSMKFFSLSLLIGTVSLGLGGCRDEVITAYRVPKENRPLPTLAAGPGATAQPAPASPAPGAKMADTPVAVSSGRNLVWAAPASWQAKPLGAMRKGSFAITGAEGATADLSITAFPGAVGGDQANIDRWRGQLGLPPVPIDQLSPPLAKITAHGLTCSVVDFTSAGGEPKRLLGAIVPFEGATWFFKLLGPEALVGSQKDAFMEFLQTIQPAAEGKTP